MRAFMRSLTLPLALTGCLSAGTPPVTTTPAPVPQPTPAPALVPSAPTPPPAPAPAPSPVRAVPSFSFTPTDRAIGNGASSAKTDAQLVAIAANPDQMPKLCPLHVGLQVAEEDLPNGQPGIYPALQKCFTLGVETNPITADTMKAASAGEAGYAAAMGPLQKAISQGAMFSEIAMNDPLNIAVGAGMSRADTYQQIAIFGAHMQAAFPGAVVGFDTAYPGTLSAQQIADIQGINAAMHALGSRGLDFVREDFNFAALGDAQRGGSYADMKLISDYAGLIGLPFEVILSGDDGWDACVKQSGAAASPADDHCWYDGLSKVAGQIIAAGMHPIFSVQPFAEGVPSAALPDSSTDTTTGAALGIAEMR